MVDIDELRMLAEDLYVNGYNRYAAAMSQAADSLEAAEKERDDLKAKIAEMEKQEPVATVIKEGDSRYWMSERLWTFPNGKYPLYALPGAQGEEEEE